MNFFKISIVVMVLLFVGDNAKAQTKYLLHDYLATINGTSNLKNWKAKVEKISGVADLKQNIDKGFTLQSFSVIMQVKSIKCYDYSIVNNETYAALKGDQFPEIIFTLTEPVANICYGFNPWSIMAKGRLTIAGVTKEMTMPIKVTYNEDKNMIVDGEQQVKMTDYNIKPPSVLCGLIKVGNLLTIKFKTTFSRMEDNAMK